LSLRARIRQRTTSYVAMLYLEIFSIEPINLSFSPHRFSLTFYFILYIYKADPITVTLINSKYNYNIKIKMSMFGNVTFKSQNKCRTRQRFAPRFPPRKGGLGPLFWALFFSPQYQLFWSKWNHWLQTGEALSQANATQPRHEKDKGRPSGTKLGFRSFHELLGCVWLVAARYCHHCQIALFTTYMCYTER
jgi:hypothetical protein